MKYTDKHKFKQPERTKDNDDRADINDLASNWGKADSVLEEIENTQGEFAIDLQTHTSSTNNPHKVNAAQTGAYSREEMDEITQNQNQAIDGAVRASEVVQENLTSHMADDSNPHRVSAGQTGAYTAEETDALLSEKLSRDGELEPEGVVITDPGGRVETSSVTPDELLSLTGISGNIQSQLNHVPKYNYLEGIEVTLTQTDWPGQDNINSQAITAIKKAYPVPALWDAVVVRVLLKGSTVHRDLMYYYLDGSLQDEFEGWRFLVEMSTVISRADGTNAGIVKSSDDIRFTDGKGKISERYVEWEDADGKYLVNSGTKDAPVLAGDVRGNADTATKAAGLDGGSGTVNIRARNMDAFVIGGTSGYPVLRPETDGVAELGDSSYRFNKIYSNEFIGNAKSTVNFTSSSQILEYCRNMANNTTFTFRCDATTTQFLTGTSVPNATAQGIMRRGSATAIDFQVFPASATIGAQYGGWTGRLTTDYTANTIAVVYSKKIPDGGSTISTVAQLIDLLNSMQVGETVHVYMGASMMNTYITQDSTINQAGQIILTKLTATAIGFFASGTDGGSGNLWSGRWYTTGGAPATGITVQFTNKYAPWASVLQQYASRIGVSASAPADLNNCLIVADTSTVSPQPVTQYWICTTAGNSANVSNKPEGFPSSAFTISYVLQRANGANDFNGLQTIYQGNYAAGTSRTQCVYTRAHYRNGGIDYFDGWVKNEPGGGGGGGGGSSSSSLYFSTQADMNAQLLAQSNNANGTFMAAADVCSVLTQGEYSNIIWGDWQRSSASAVRLSFSLAQTATFAQKHSTAYNPTTGSVTVYDNSNNMYGRLSAANTWTQPQTVPTPTADGHAVNKKYVDDALSGSGNSNYVSEAIYDGNVFGTGRGFSFVESIRVCCSRFGNLIELFLAHPMGVLVPALAITVTSGVSVGNAKIEGPNLSLGLPTPLFPSLMSWPVRLYTGTPMEYYCDATIEIRNYGGSLALWLFFENPQIITSGQFFNMYTNGFQGTYIAANEV